MVQKTKNSLYKSVGFATTGMLWFFITERNGKIQICILGLVCILAACLGSSSTEWCFILLSGAMVIGLEMLNTAIEQFCDDYNPGFKQSIKFIKDASAGAVLCASILGTIIGLIIFVPKFLEFLK
jgi:diacylglycerol kinase